MENWRTSAWPIGQLFRNYATRRWDWVVSGIDDFQRGFLKFQGIGLIDSHVLVGIWGKTQVGKTSLLLTMLGIRPERQQDLYTALRGGQTEGESATSVPMIYRRGTSPHFFIRMPGATPIECVSLTVLARWVGELRQDTLNRHEALPDAVVLEIPTEYFDPAVSERRQLAVEVLDFPGADAKSPAERQLVRHYFTTYLPQCRAVIVVNKVREISQMPRDLDGFRTLAEVIYVVTALFSNRSTQELIRKCNLTEASLSDYLAEEMGEEISPESCYGVEIGDTLKGLAADHPEIYRVAVDWSNRQITALTQLLSAAVSPERLLQRVIERTDRIAGLAKTEEEEFDRQLSRIKKAQQTLMANAKELTTMLFRLREKYLAEGPPQIKPAVVYLPRPQVVLKRHRRDLDFWVDQYETQARRMREHYQDQVEGAKADLDPLLLRLAGPLAWEPNELPNSIAIAKRLMMAMMADPDGLRDVVDNALRQPSDWYHQSAQRVISHHWEVAMDMLAKPFDHQVQVLERSMGLLHGEFDRRQSEKVDNERRWDHDRQHVQALGLYMQQAFERALRSILADVSKASLPQQQRWVAHQFANLMMRDYERVLNSAGVGSEGGAPAV